jgi:hypothetical protein
MKFPIPNFTESVQLKPHRNPQTGEWTDMKVIGATAATSTPTNHIQDQITGVWE